MGRIKINPARAVRGGADTGEFESEFVRSRALEAKLIS